MVIREFETEITKHVLKNNIPPHMEAYWLLLVNENLETLRRLLHIHESPKNL